MTTVAQIKLDQQLEAVEQSLLGINERSKSLIEIKRDALTINGSPLRIDRLREWHQECQDAYEKLNTVTGLPDNTLALQRRRGRKVAQLEKRVRQWDEAQEKLSELRDQELVLRERLAKLKSELKEFEG